jgi:hypothetical protein
VDRDTRHGGLQAARVEHTGQHDWSLRQQRWVDVQPGQLYELTGWVRVRGEGNTTLCVTLRDGRQAVTGWNFAGQTAHADDDWQRLHSRFAVPPGTAALQVRLIGTGPATIWFDDAALERTGRLEDFRADDLPPALRLSNATLDVTFRPADGTFAVVDRRGAASWRQRAGGPLCVTGARKIAGRLRLQLLDPERHPRRPRYPARATLS